MPSGVYKRTEKNIENLRKAKIGTVGFWRGKKRPEISGVNNGLHIYMESHKGENHWKWKSDRTQLAKRQERNDSAYKNWRLEVYKKDNFKCRIANQDCSGRIIAHHILSWIDFPELRYQVNNGITLCQAHHPRRRAEEKRLIPIFSELVPVLNV